jgi:hypothetical protein
LETNGVVALGVVALGLAALVAAAALIAETPYRAAPTTPPTSIDPAMVAAAIVFLNPIMTWSLPCFIPLAIERLESSLTPATQRGV